MFEFVDAVEWAANYTAPCASLWADLKAENF